MTTRETCRHGIDYLNMSGCSDCRDESVPYGGVAGGFGTRDFNVHAGLDPYSIPGPVKTKKIYLASSWRNVYQPELIFALRAAGFEVYDFRNPQVEGPPGAPPEGFSWKQIDPGWGRDRTHLLERYRAMLAHPVAQAGFDADFNAMKWADTCVIALPSGKSAHLEAGWMAGAGKKLVVYMPPATRRCAACLGGGWVDSGDPMRNDRCVPCEGTGDVLLWNFEPELMYLIGGGPEVLVFDHEELLERLHA